MELVRLLCFALILTGVLITLARLDTFSYRTPVYAQKASSANTTLTTTHESTQKRIEQLIAYGCFDVGKPRAASNNMPNHRYLAWRLIGPAATAKPFSNRTSNLPPSKESGQGDCGRANQMDAYKQKAVSLIKPIEVL